MSDYDVEELLMALDRMYEKAIKAMRDIISLKTTAIKHISDVIIAFKHVIDSKDNYFVSQMSLDNWFANFRYEVPKDVVIDVEDDMEKYKEYLAGELDDLEKRVNECCQFLEQVY